MPLNPVDYSRMLNKPDYSGIADIFENYYKGYELGQTPEKLAQERLARELQNQIYGVQAQYAGPQAEASLQNQLLQNQYLPQEKQALINKYVQDVKESLAHQGLYTAQEREAIANAMQNELVNEMIGGNQQQAGPQGKYGNNMPPPTGGTTIPYAPGQQPTRPSVADTHPDIYNPIADAFLEKKLGVKPQLIEDKVTGEQYLYHPLSGKKELIHAGDSAEAAKYYEHLGKQRGDAVEASYGRLDAAYAKQPLLDELLEISNRPEFHRGIGPISDIFSRYGFSSKESQRLIGEVRTLLGTNVNHALRQFGARITNKEVDAMNRIKGSTSDSPYVLKSQILLNNSLNKMDIEAEQAFNKYVNEKDDKGKFKYSVAEARQKAAGDVNLSEIRKITQLEDMGHRIAKSSKKPFEDIMDTALTFAQKYNLSFEEALEKTEKLYVIKD